MGWALGVPLLVHPWWVVLPFFVSTMGTLGVILTLVFQFAHCVEGADFPAARGGALRSSDERAVHQVRTTVDFGQGNRRMNSKRRRDPLRDGPDAEAGPDESPA